MSEPDSPSAAKKRTLEIIVSIALVVFGLVIMWDSHRLGNGWTPDGPQSGYFPFYIGLIMSAASAINLVGVIRANGGDSFVSRDEIRLVGAMFFPTLVFLFIMQWIGIYVASVIFIAFFMRWQGKFSWLRCAIVSIATTLVLFLMFEIWFKVPLLKGPLEAALGF